MTTLRFALALVAFSGAASAQVLSEREASAALHEYFSVAINGQTAVKDGLANGDLGKVFVEAGVMGRVLAGAVTIVRK